MLLRRFLFACLFAVALAGFFAGPVAAQTIVERLITPGPLAAAHARAEGDCSNCHASFQRAAQNSKCIDCHEEVGRDIARRVKYHGRSGQARTASCASCHSDHEGRNYALIRLDRQGFNHNLTDYPLAGGHAGVACASCHGSGNNYRGTTTTCATCHRTDDPHRGRLGARCQDCHQVADWTRLRPYNHLDVTGFALTGAHAQTTCLSCHRGQQWAGLETTCISCHRADDSHRGSRGTNCASCHRTSSWTSVTFDHDSTGFSLVGGHAEAACASCHGAANAVRQPSRSCNSCHAQDDVHEGGNGTDCQNCHNARDWKQVRFNHDSMTEFPLKGAHRQATCEGCHAQPPRVAAPPVTCIGCHREDDEHQGRNGEDCAKCHVEASWTEVTFDHDTMTQFPLIGAHSAATCETCHTSPTGEMALESDCASCHLDEDAHAGNLGTGCSTCHDTVDWVTNIRFDHELTRFPLLGAHGGQECTACHTDKSFTATGTACVDCHVDDHHLGTLGTPANCQSCHNTADWKTWVFDHDRQTSFVLTGRHNGLVCSACHGRAGDPAQVGNQCIDCHRREDRHRGQFGQDCARCHVSSSFADIILPE